MSEAVDNKFCDVTSLCGLVYIYTFVIYRPIYIYIYLQLKPIWAAPTTVYQWIDSDKPL